MIKYTYTNLTPFKWYVLENFPFIEEDFDALTNWQLFCKLGKEMNKIINSVNTSGTQVETLTTAFNELQNYVTNYFNNLDVQEEINNKLDEMVQDGTLEQILNKFFTETTGLTFSTFQDLKENVQLAVGNKCKTLGFYGVNDGGEGLYYITDTENNTIPQIKINDTLYANLIFNKYINVKSMGAYGDNIHDDTSLLQSIINLGFSMYFPKGNYLVSKNETLNFENNDEPCLAIQTKNDMTITGENATLISNVHGQGILEIINSNNITVNGLKFKGLGVFPSLDGTSGRGEKGTETEGYYTSGFWGSYKNNSYDTSNFTTHASINNGQAWGKFNGGFIGNIANGILIHNNSNYVIVKNCEMHGFNYAGIQIGFLGDSQTTLDSENIKILNNKIHDCYNSGINIVTCKNYTLENNTIYNIGHPNALYTDVNCDPGYAISHNSSQNSQAKKGIINNNMIYNVKRKGIDLHGGENVIISNNIIDNALVAGIYAFAVKNQLITQDINIINNQILNSSYCTNKLAPITVGGQIDSTSSDTLQKNVIINNNLIKNCGGTNQGMISCRCGENINISNNTISDINELNTTNIYAIVAGQITQYNSKLVIISNNLLDINNDLVNGGIYCLNSENGIVSGNILNIPDVTQIGTNESNISVFGNYTVSDSVQGLSTQGFALPYLNSVNTMKKSQLASVLNTLYFKDVNGNLNYIPKLINLTISANGTENPTVNINQGEEFINNVVSNQRGVQINLKNLSNKVAVFYNLTNAEGLNNGSTHYNYIYTREISNTTIILGIKASTDSSSHIPIANCTAGSLNVTILA